MKTYWLNVKSQTGKQTQFANLDFVQLKRIIRDLKGWGYSPIKKGWPLRVNQYNLGVNRRVATYRSL